MENKILNFSQINQMIDELSKKIITDNIKSIALIGDLGTGKTHISKRICKNLGVTENVKSPTFTYLIEYDLEDIKIVHFDLYRLSNIDELYEVGYQEYVDDDNTLLLIEWANNVPEVIEEASVVISLEYFDENSRYVNIKGINLNI